jgi:hypothetical protein
VASVRTSFLFCCYQVGSYWTDGPHLWILSLIDGLLAGSEDPLWFSHWNQNTGSHWASPFCL